MENLTPADRVYDNESMTGELYKRGKYLKYLLESSVEIILFIDRDGCIAYCTNAMLRLANVGDFSAIAGKPYQCLYAMFGGESLVREGEAHYERAKKSLKASSVEAYIDFSGKGETRIYNINAVPMIDGEGVFDGVIVTHYDTTDVRNLEADEYTRIMLDATPLACSLWDEKGNLLDCNQEALRMFGIPDKSDYAKYKNNLSPVFQSDGTRSDITLESNERKAFDTGYIQFGWMHKTLRGEALPTEKTFVRVPWRDGYRLAKYTRDLRKLTETQRMAQKADARSREFETRMQAAQVASEVKSRFLASMSHEIRTPMNAIIGMSDLMRTDNMDITQRVFFDDIKKMSRSLLQIINDVLDFSRIEAGRLEIVPVHFYMMELYNNICSVSRFLADTKGLYFLDSIDASTPSVIYGDDVRIRQIIFNIINNAIKYTHEGSVSFDVRKVTKNERDFLSFVVKDTGIGIKEEDLPKLFNAFYQVDMAVNHGIDGSGLGLSITKNLVALMDGEISLQSEYGEGSEFTIMLPLIEGNAELVENQSSSSYVIAKDGARVLVVDDSQINLKVAAAYLERHNIWAETALSGPEAIMKVHRKNAHYDLIFMDHMMPEMNGIETTCKIREMGYKDIPIIALTANAIEGIRDLYIKADMNDFISKPIDPKELNKVLIRWLPWDLVQRSVQGQPPMGESYAAYPDGIGAGGGPAGASGGFMGEGVGGGPVGAASGAAGRQTYAEAGIGDGQTSAASGAAGNAPENSRAFIKNPIINFTMGLGNTLGDRNLYYKLLSDFLVDHGLDHRKIKDAINKSEINEASRLAHTLKGTSALIGANRLRQVAFSIETLLGEGEFEKALKGLDILDFELTAAIDVIDQFQTQIRPAPQPPSTPSGPADGLANEQTGGHAGGPTVVPASGPAGGPRISEADSLAEARNLIDALAPLLDAGDTRSLEYTGRISSTLAPMDAEAGTLLEQIDNFDFADAKATLDKIRTRLGI